MRAKHVTYTGRKLHVFKGTWLKRPGTQYSSSNGTDLRVIVQHFDGDAAVTVRVVKGNAFKDPDHFFELENVNASAEIGPDGWELVVESFAGLYNVMRFPT